MSHLFMCDTPGPRMWAVFIGRAVRQAAWSPAEEAQRWVSALAERLGTDWRVCCWVINKVVWGQFNRERKNWEWAQNKQIPLPTMQEQEWEYECNGELVLKMFFF